ncbi:transglycosylase domain-containing protein [Texcoconibacillus texcoconensis]|uniref:Penicillin-binding protein n=1 Tax=Texcoconibacillus texcoconensis TaxID=1095777 RepID=A0A840QN35_9BACI|nr:transglycosylase domain-containing protein [Texcoconibacillus texcoconensis]MBB5172768.1 penicillin-binding protein [Texcoconibacillus texcoconensis]
MSNKRYTNRQDAKGRSFNRQSWFKNLRITSKVVWNLFLVFLATILIGTMFVGGAGAGYFASLVNDEPIRSYDDMKKDIYDYEEISEVYFADDMYLGELPSELERREIPLEDISDHLIEAVIATEDEYFFNHDGIVPRSLMRATYQEFSGAPVQTGGSTLTQQLIKNQILSSEVSFERKASEILLAMRLENFFEKDEILEAYLNVVPFGRNASGRQIAGAQAAAQGIFGVDASDLNLAQAAFLAGKPQSPFAYTPFTSVGEVKDNFDAGLNRMKTVLNRMKGAGFIDEEEYNEAMDYDIRENLTESTPSTYSKYPYLTQEVERRAVRIVKEQLLEEDEINLDEIDNIEQRQQLSADYSQQARRNLRRNGYRIHLTIDKEIYDAHQEVVQDDSLFANNKSLDGEDYQEEVGSVMIENGTGRILSFVGGRDYEIQNYNHATQMFRDNGSTMKPLLTYAVGLETGHLQPGYITPDIPYEYETNGQQVRNFDRNHLGFITAREALQRSRNVPAVREFNELDHDVLREGLLNNGITNLDDHQPYEATALGSHGTTVEMNTNAFSTFANGGEHVESYMIESIDTPDGDSIYERESETNEAFSEQTSYLLVDMMRDVLKSPGTASGLPGMLNFQTDLAGKTGTSSDYADSWFVGSNPNVTLGVWIGYDDSRLRLTSVHEGRSYGVRTQRIWANLANSVHDIDENIFSANEEFQMPNNIVRQSVCSISGKLPSDICEEIGLVETDLFNAEHVPTESDDSLTKAEYVQIGDDLYTALESTPEVFLREGVAVDEEYFDFLDGDTAELLNYFPDDWEESLVPDEEAPDNGNTPESPNVQEIDGQITWEEHPEEDVVGYNIYERSDEDDNWSEVTNIRADESLAYEASNGMIAITAVDVAGRESDYTEVILNVIDDEEDEQDRQDEEDGEKEEEKDENEDSEDDDQDESDE